MTQSKKELLLAALNNQPVDRVPVGFWFHFTEVDERQLGLEKPEIVQKNISGHLKFYEDFKPDFVKIMSDGFFGYPRELLRGISSVKEAAELAPLGPEHTWITKQVELVKTLTAKFGGEVLTFYNVFAPVKYFRLLQSTDEYGQVARLIAEDKEAFKRLLDVIASDLATLSEKVVQEGGADGIYFCVQNLPHPQLTKEVYREVITPSEKKVLAAANAVSENNILHICGFKGVRNDLSWYTDYEAKAVNWAVNVENVPLADGKRLFGGRTVIGGFDNTPEGLLYQNGSQSEIEAYTEGLVKGAGKRGVILSADCTVPNDIDVKRLEWVRAKAASIQTL